MEASMAHGYLSATVKGYAQKREQARRSHAPRRDEDWAKKLSQSLGQYGMAKSGPSPDGPMVN